MVISLYFSWNVPPEVSLTAILGCTQSFGWGSSGNNGGRRSPNHPILYRRQNTTSNNNRPLSHQMKCLWKSSIIENCSLLLFCFFIHYDACIRVRKAHHSVQQASIHSQKKWTDAKIGKKSQVWLLIGNWFLVI